MAAMLRDSVVVVVVVVVRTRPRAIPLAMITTRKWTHGFPLISHDANGAPLGSSAIKRSYPDTLISKSMVSFADSPFKLPALLPPSRFLEPLVLALGTVKLLLAAEQRALLVFRAKNSIWDSFAGQFVNASSIV